MVTRKEFEEANKRMQEMLATTPHAVAVRYDRRTNRIMIQLNTKLDIAFNPQDVQGVEDATPAELSEIEISPSGFGIYFPKIDADIYIPGLLEGILGTRKWMASRMGRQGGLAKSKAKTAAARQNGKLGGRPKKKVAKVA